MKPEDELNVLFKSFGEVYKEKHKLEIQDHLKDKSEDYKTGYLEGRVDQINVSQELVDKIFRS